MFLHDRVDAQDAFGMACEDLWKGLPHFEGRASTKTWFYTLARNAALRLRRTPGQRNVAPLSEISELAAVVRSRTDPYLESDMRQAVAGIRAALDEADRALLGLRVDQEMSWNVIAQIMGTPEASPNELSRAAARLRKRFQSVKETIYERAREQGLLAKMRTTDES
jgi:RNA polymerase sigma-70 factor (ECF subfamily)